MEEYEIIRREVIVKGKSQRQVARELRHGRHTVKKALENSSPPGYRRSKQLDRPKIDPVKHIIDAWLEEDKKLKRKKRRSKTVIFQQLRDDYGFGGSYSAVRRYITHKQATTAEVFFPLQFDPGEEAQVDWGDIKLLIGGVERDVDLFCMRACYSTGSFVRAYERQITECLLDGHCHAYDFFGGVFARNAYDNPKTVVITVGKGQDRKLTSKFIELKSHYLFETRFCNIASGNEKGHVENLVKYAKRNILAGRNSFASMDELNQYLLEQCNKHFDQKPQGSDKTRRELFAEEKQYLLDLPQAPFKACVRKSTITSKQSLVRFDNNKYSLPVRWAHHPVVIEGYADRVEVYAGDELAASHVRSYDSGKYKLDYLHYISLLERKPGGIHNGRPFKGEPWGEDLARMRRELEYRYANEGTKKFINVLLLFSEFPEADVKRAVKTCIERRAFCDEAVRSTLTYIPRKRFGKLDLSDNPKLAAIGDLSRPTTSYEQLTAKGVAI